MKKALIAMSGGVDSSVAAYTVSKAGFKCIGCTMKLYGGTDSEGGEYTKTCCSADDVEDARSVAYKLSMPYYVFNFTRDFEEKVIKNFVCSYENGMTPNPCIECNRRMKFDMLYERARLLGCDYVVTGHYARIEFDGEKYTLHKAFDGNKDQSYVLYSMTQQQLAHTLFPLGKSNKSEIREIAQSQGFVNAQKPDSQDICFVPDGDYGSFIERYTEKTYPEGNFIDKNGKVLGRHRGIIRYTIGQRRGLATAFSKRMYVCKINPKENTVTLGDNEDLFSKELYVSNFNYIGGEAMTEPFRCKAKIRYRQPEQWANVTPVNDNCVKIVFDEPQRAVTPGQSAVLYDGDRVIGGGTVQPGDFEPER